MTIMDYAKKSISKKKRKHHITDRSSRGRSGKGRIRAKLFNPMLIMVILVGLLFTCAIFYVDYAGSFVDFNKLTKKIENFKFVKKGVEKSKNKEKQEATAALKKTPKFEFYYMLPKMSVELNNKAQRVDTLPKTAASSNNSNNAVVSTEQNLNSVVHDSNGPYVLQLASFKDIKDAEELRARLILEGFNVVIQTVKLSSGEVWHRVKSTKVNNMVLAENLNNQLKSHNINSIILTDKG